jgi:RNA polymerase sigma-70 factor (ECF subfamily)
MVSKREMTATSATSVRSDERDQILLKRVAERDRAAFEELYLNYHRRLARFLLRFTTRYEVAEEVINDTFWIVWQKAADFRGASRVSTWIMGIAYRRALKSVNKLRDEPTSEDIETLAATMSDEPLAREEQRELVLRALNTLSYDQRMAIELAYYLGHSCEEIAQIMNCPVGTVKARMFHARTKLRTVVQSLSGGTAEGLL